MEQKDNGKSFIFRNMDWVEDILTTSEMGLWAMVTDQEMSRIEFYIDQTMARLLGLKEDLDPEACFEFWYKRINRGNYAYVNEAMKRIIETDKLCEIQYTWNHPEWGDIPVRCAGRSKELADKRILITGYHQNMNVLDQMMRWTLYMSGEEIFEFNTNTRTALVYTDKKLIYGDERQLKDFPHCVIKNQVVHPQSSGPFLQAFRRLERGENAHCEVRLKNYTGEYGWFALDLEIMAYEKDSPGIVLGRVQDISRQKELETAYIRVKRVNHLLQQELLAYGDVDLTQNQVLRLSGKWKEYQYLWADCTYDQFIKKIASESVKPEHRDAFILTFSRDTLEQRFHDGEHTASQEYRCLRDHDMMRWVRMDAYMYTDPEEGHIGAFVCMRDIDRIKEMELRLDGGEKDGAGTPEKKFERILWAAGESACLINPDRHEFITANQAFYREIGKTEEECRGKACYELIYGKTSPCTFCNRLLWERDHFSLWEKVDPGRGLRRLVKTKLVEWEGKEALLVIGMDMSQSKERREFNPEEECIQRMAYKVISGIYAMTEAPDLEEAMKRLLDILASYYEAGHIQMFLNREDTFGCRCICSMNYGQRNTDRQMEQDMEAWLGGRRPDAVMDFIELQDMIGESFEVFKDMEKEQITDLSVFPIVSHKGTLGYIVMFDRRNRKPLELMDMLIYFIAQEINRRQDSKRLHYSIYHDALTGLLNRGSYDEYRRQYKADQVVSLGVIVVDINDLKSVNDLKGTEAGDKLICSAAEIIKNHFPDHRVFRLNSNEFDIVMEDVSSVEFEQRTGRLLQEIGGQGHLPAAVGRVWDDREKNLDWAMKQASELMRIDKQRYYDNKPSFKEKGRMELIKGLLLSLERGEFHVVLQPKLYLSTGRCAGAEALVRYNDGERLVPPSRFIGALERENLISYIDLYVMEECCRLLEKWKKEGREGQVLSFNFSRMTLLKEDIVESVESIVRKYDVKPEALEIEVTESIGDLGRDLVYKALGKLKKKGYRISLDDFGTRYSNLDILSDVEFDVLKLDKSLVDKIGRDNVSRQIVKHVIAMCRDMKILTVAEGVEEPLQADYLEQSRCIVGQGYLYGRPMAVEDFETGFLEKYTI